MWAIFHSTISIDDILTLPMQLLEGLVFTPIIKDVLVKYMDGMMSALLCPHGIFQNLT